MTSRTKERWPQADILVKYLRDYAAPQEVGLKIKYNTTVTNVERADGVAQPGHADSKFHDGFLLTTEHSSGKTSRTDCGVVIMASGIDIPNVPSNVDGIEHAIGYEQLPKTGEKFEAETVAVFGYGNAAFETVDSISSHANYVHMFGGRTNSERFAKDTHQFVSWESRYVGDLRAINAGTLDSYTLKSLDGIGLGELNGLKIVKCGPNGTKICFFLKGEPAVWNGNPNGQRNQKVETITLGLFSAKNDPWAREFVKKLGSARVNTNADKAKAASRQSSSDISCQLSGANGKNGKPTLVNGEISNDVETLTVVAAAVEIPDLVDALMHFAGRTGNNYPMVFDKVVRCLGWKHDTARYSTSASPWMQHNLKYPVMTSEYESATVPGMYFAGQLGHGKDHKRSAGGFIHGFRYTTRALFRILETKYYQQQWPGQNVYAEVNAWDGGLGLGGIGCNAGDLLIQAPEGCTAPKEMTSPFETLLNKIFTRIDTSSGPYQMVAILGDGVIFRCPKSNAATDGADTTEIEAEYLEEIPMDHFNEKYANLPRLWWSFGYQKQRKALWPLWTYFQVQFWYYAGDCAAPASDPTKHNHFGGHADGRYHPGSTTNKEPSRPVVKELVQLHEDVHTRWGQPNKRVRIGQWLHQKIAALRAGQINNPNENEDHWVHPSRAAESSPQETAETEDAEAMDNLPHQTQEPKIKIDWSRPATGNVKNWGGAHVDLNFFNRRDAPVQLWNNPSTETNKAISQFEPGPILAPGEGKRIVSHEYERWEARNLDGTLAGKWWIDRGNGLIQDIAV